MPDREGPPTAPKLSPTVKLLGAASFLNDVASEMIAPVLPIFLTTRLGAGPAAVGLIEGLAEAASSLLKWISGRAADRSRRTRPLVLWGYTISNVARPLTAFAGAWPVVLALRFLDRVGKGLRTAPRDALISRTTDPSARGRAFGFHRAMDHLGATVGPLIAFALMAAGLSIDSVFLASAAPGILVIALLAWRLAEPRDAPPQIAEPAAPGPAVAQSPPAPGPAAVAGAVSGRQVATREAVGPARLRAMAAAVLLQAFAAVPDAFLVLWASERGMATAAIPLVWAASHAVRSPVVRWAGGWSDGRNRTAVVSVGWFARVAGLAALAWAPIGVVWTPVLFVAWAGISASTEGAERALVADLTSERAQGRAYGLYHMLVGLAALPGAVVFGWIWQASEFQVAFLFSAAVTIVAAGLLAFAASARPARG